MSCTQNGHKSLGKRGNPSDIASDAKANGKYFILTFKYNSIKKERLQSRQGYFSFRYCKSWRLLQLSRYRSLDYHNSERKRHCQPVSNSVVMLRSHFRSKGCHWQRPYWFRKDIRFCSTHCGVPQSKRSFWIWQNSSYIHGTNERVSHPDY